MVVHSVVLGTERSDGYDVGSIPGIIAHHSIPTLFCKGAFKCLNDPSWLQFYPSDGNDRQAVNL